MEPLPDLGTLADEDLKRLIDQYTQEELEAEFRQIVEEIMQTEESTALG